MRKNIKKQGKIIGWISAGLLAVLGLSLGLIFGLRVSGHDNVAFSAEKTKLWDMITATPADTAHAVFINGFVGTSIVEKYLMENVKGKFSVDIIRSYKSTGHAPDEEEKVAKYNQQFLKGDVTKYANVIDKAMELSHMKSYFWFNDKKEMIRALTGSGNFSNNALLNAPSYKEVLYDVTNYEGIGRDLFCGGINATQQTKTTRLSQIYQANCAGFDIDKKETYQSGQNAIKVKSQFNDIVNLHQQNPKLKGAKGLLILSGDGGTEVIKEYLDQTAADNINLDVFVGNSPVGFKPILEKQMIADEKYSNRLNIIREHPRGSIEDDQGLIKNTTAKTHTKLYAWYNAQNELLAFWSGSANFTENGVKNNQSFREILLEMPLKNLNWKDELICKVVGAFKTKPSQRIQEFCR